MSYIERTSAIDHRHVIASMVAVFVILFAYSASYKFVLLLFGIRTDASSASFAVTVGTFYLALLAGAGHGIIPFLVSRSGIYFSLFLAFAAVTLLWAPSGVVELPQSFAAFLPQDFPHPLFKLLNLFLFSAVPLVISYEMARWSSHFTRIAAASIIMLGLVFGIAAFAIGNISDVIMLASIGGLADSDIGSNRILVGLMFGSATLASVGVLISSNVLWRYRAVAAVALVISAYWVGESASRQAILGSLICVFVLVFTRFFIGKEVTFARVTTGALVLVAFFAAGALIAGNSALRTFDQALGDASAQRFESLESGGGLLFDMERGSLLHTALSCWADSPFVGQGIGAFPVVEGDMNWNNHPHNAVLELMCEVGLIGAGLFVVAFGILGYACIPLFRHPSFEAKATSAIVLLLTFSANVSTSYAYSRTLFIMIGICYGLRTRLKNEEEHSWA
ncbi:MAG: O-antigen ligase family protein [Proteobacteria bacterium]|nr:O-antigen ligase family protein [Pseudomonadota bacterium]